MAWDCSPIKFTTNLADTVNLYCWIVISRSSTTFKRPSLSILSCNCCSSNSNPALVNPLLWNSPGLRPCAVENLSTKLEKKTLFPSHNPLILLPRLCNSLALLSSSLYLGKGVVTRIFTKAFLACTALMKIETDLSKINCLFNMSALRRIAVTTL